MCVVDDTALDLVYKREAIVCFDTFEENLEFDAILNIMHIKHPVSKEIQCVLLVGKYDILWNLNITTVALKRKCIFEKGKSGKDWNSYYKDESQGIIW